MPNLSSLNPEIRDMLGRMARVITSARGGAYKHKARKEVIKQLAKVNQPDIPLLVPVNCFLSWYKYPLGS